MRAHLLVALAAVLLLAAEEQQPQSKDELGQLRILENQVLAAMKNRDQTTLERLLRENYVEILGPQRLTKIELLKSLTPSHITDYAMEDVRLVPLGRDAAILTYKLAPKGKAR